MMRLLLVGLGLCTAVTPCGCKRAAEQEKVSSKSASAAREDHTRDNGADHAHANGGDHGHEQAAGDDQDADHHDEVDLGTFAIGDVQVTFAQGHGKVEAGKEGHLVIKLPYSDNGATAVRVWLGTADRTASYVGKGEYAPSHDDYDVHAIAPDPLPADAMWWVEIEKPDGTRSVGSVKPLME